MDGRDRHCGGLSQIRVRLGIENSDLNLKCVTLNGVKGLPREARGFFRHYVPSE